MHICPLGCQDLAGVNLDDCLDTYFPRMLSDQMGLEIRADYDMYWRRDRDGGLFVQGNVANYFDIYLANDEAPRLEWRCEPSMWCW